MPALCASAIMVTAKAGAINSGIKVKSGSTGLGSESGIAPRLDTSGTVVRLSSGTNAEATTSPISNDALLRYFTRSSPTIKTMATMPTRKICGLI